MVISKLALEDWCWLASQRPWRRPATRKAWVAKSMEHAQRRSSMQQLGGSRPKNDWNRPEAYQYGPAWPRRPGRVSRACGTSS